MRLSIVIPSFNQDKYIGQTFDSLLTQDEGLDLEVLIMDGGSTDVSLEVIREYIPRLIKRGYRVISISEPDRGQSDAINKGFRLSTGEVVTYINSDDYLEPFILQRILQRFDVPDRPQWAYGGWKFVAQDRTIYRTVQPKKFSQQRLQTICNIIQPSCFYRREFLFQVGLLNENLHLAMDYDLWLRMAKKCDPAILPWIVSNARYYLNTKSSTRGLEHLRQALQVQKNYSKGITIRSIQYFYYLRGLVVIALRRDISQRIDAYRKQHG